MTTRPSLPIFITAPPATSTTSSPCRRWCSTVPRLIRTSVASQTVYINGVNTITHDSNSKELDNIQLTGAADYTPPTVTITSPTANQQWSNSSFTITGKASDNIAVTHVFYSINNTGFFPATPTNVNNWSNWTASVTLTPGTNTVSAYATDVNGNISATTTVKFVYVLSAEDGQRNWRRAASPRITTASCC